MALFLVSSWRMPDPQRTIILRQGDCYGESGEKGAQLCSAPACHSCLVFPIQKETRKTHAIVVKLGVFI